MVAVVIDLYLRGLNCSSARAARAKDKAKSVTQAALSMAFLVFSRIMPQEKARAVPAVLSTKSVSEDPHLPEKVSGLGGRKVGVGKNNSNFKALDHLPMICSGMHPT